MAEPSPRPLKVFLCHASADKPVVRKLYRYLRSKGMDPWLDAEKLLPGENWEVEIPKALFDSDVILVCLSKNSINKEGYVQKEIVFALDKAMEKPDGTIFIVPAKLEECEVPQRLNRYQWVDLYRDGYKRLMLSLNKRAAQLGPEVKQAIVSDDTLEREKIELEAKERLDRENAEREMANLDTDGKAARDKTEHEAVKKIKFEKTEQEIREKLATKLPLWSIGLIALAVLTLIVWSLTSLSASLQTTQTPSTTQTPFVGTATKTPAPTMSTATAHAISTVTAILTSAQTPTPSIGSIMTGKDGATLVYVPEGEFIMGSDIGRSDEKPAHTVYLDAFWIDQTEATNKMYEQCVDNGVCQQPTGLNSYTHSYYYGNSEFDNYPVIYVDWNMAKAYCEWAGRRLPTEAEWEKAARGTDERIYPWGNDAPNSKLLNYNQNMGDTTVVKNYPNTVSFYGTYDMAGNVWEWVNDWYGETYYQGSPFRNPLGPSVGQYRVLRGGAWTYVVNYVRSAIRDSYDPTYSFYYIGFRCAVSETP